MKRYSLLIVLSLATFLNVESQVKTYFTLDIGPTWDLSQISDPGVSFSVSAIPNTIEGISIWQEIIPNLSIGTGAYFHHYAFSINPKDSRNHQPSSKAFTALLIPARLSYRLNIDDLPLSLSGIIGYQYGFIINETPQQGFNSTISLENEVTIDYSLPATTLSQNSLQLIETGFSLDYRFDNNWQMSFAVSYFSGFTEVKNSILSYQTSKGNSYEAKYSSEGSRWQSNLSIGIPLSNMWENKDLKRHRQIEQSKNKGRKIRVKRHIYFGGDLGALWRSFSTTNPAIGARPLEKRGIFRYSNLHTGAFFGYLTPGGIAIDIGAYYQRSSSFFSLMYDHEVDFVNKEHAPMFLEFPVMLRRAYQLYNEDFSIVPAIGGSVISHLGAHTFASGSDSFEISTLSGPSNGNVNYGASRLVKFGFMVKASLGAEYKLPTDLPLTAIADVGYSHGIRDIDQIQVSTSINETPYISYITYNGSAWNFSIGIKYTILLGKENRKCGAESRMR